MNQRRAALIGVDVERGRRERKNNIVNARANAREERLNNRRRLENTDVAGDASFASDSNQGGARSLEELPSNVSKLMSDNLEAQLEATSYFRKLLSIEKRPPIEDVVRQPNVVRRLVEFLGYDHNQRLQFEAAWALTNIASGTTQHTRYVIECGAIPIFVRILMSPSEEVREQAVWALGNIAGDHPTTRDMVLEAGALPPLQQLLAAENNATRSMVRNATWTLSNFCRGKPAPHFELTKAALPTLRYLISQPTGADADDEIMTDACWALSYLSDGPNERIQAVVEANVSLRLVELLSHDKDAVVVPALRTVGNVVTGTDEQTQVVLNCNALQALYSILANAQHHKKSITKEACWTVSNVTAGTKEQISAVIDSGCVDPIVNLLKNGELEIKREAAWAISNATSGGDPTQIQQLVQYGCIPPLCELLRVMDPRVVQVALEGLKNILSAAEKLRALPGSNGENVYAVMLEDAGGLDLLENLQNHSSEDVSSKAVEILSTFFEVLPDDENVTPSVDQAGMFNFAGGEATAPAAAAAAPQQGMESSQGTSFNFGGL